MEISHFIIFGLSLIIVIFITVVIVRLVTQIANLKQELNSTNISYQRDIIRLEKQIKYLTKQTSSNTNLADVDRLDTLIKNMSKILDTQISEAERTKHIVSSSISPEN